MIRKIVNFMTPVAGFHVLRRGLISFIVEMKSFPPSDFDQKF